MRWDSASCWLYIFNLSLSSLDKHGLPGSPVAVAMWLHCNESRTADSDEETETVSTRALIEPCVAVGDCWTTRGEICRVYMPEQLKNLCTVKVCECNPSWRGPMHTHLCGKEAHFTFNLQTQTDKHREAWSFACSCRICQRLMHFLWVQGKD